MKKFMIIMLFLIFGTTIANAEIQGYNHRRYPLPTRHHQWQRGNNFDNLSMAKQKRLERLEHKAFQNSFGHDRTENRIARLEQQMLGAIQTGDLDTRYRRLERMMYKNNYNTIPKNNIWANIGNILNGGAMTGYTYTPNNFDNYFPINDNDYGYQERWEDDKGNYFYNNRQMGTGMGIKLLD